MKTFELYNKNKKCDNKDSSFNMKFKLDYETNS